MRQFNVKLKYGSKHGPLIEVDTSGEMLIHLSEAPKLVNANLKVIDMIAKHYDVPKSRIEIVRGMSSRDKVIRIRD